MLQNPNGIHDSMQERKISYQENFIHSIISMANIVNRFDTTALAASLPILFDKAMGALIYSVITLRLPTLSPTSLPPVLSLLSLRGDGAVTRRLYCSNHATAMPRFGSAG